MCICDLNQIHGYYAIAKLKTNTEYYHDNYRNRLSHPLPAFILSPEDFRDPHPIEAYTSMFMLDS